MPTPISDEQPAEALLGLDLATARRAACDTTEAKISSDMPLPMPRWVISSPIHISKRGAGGEREHDQAIRGTVKFWSPPNRSSPVVLLTLPKPPPPLWNR